MIIVMVNVDCYVYQGACFLLSRDNLQRFTVQFNVAISHDSQNPQENPLLVERSAGSHGLYRLQGFIRGDLPVQTNCFCHITEGAQSVS